jgi:exodeoxyribonuclease V beta subunit
MADRGDEGPDHDAVRLPPLDAAPGAAARTIFTFPRGARAGRCLHAVLERVDFADPDPAPRRAVVERELDRFGFDAAWAPVVEDMVLRLSDAPLDPGGRVRLADVPRTRRLDELEFTYPIERFDVAGLQALLRAHGFGGGAFDESIAGLAFGEVRGFMRGYIDLVFEADGRFWLIDWKSNWLGPDAADYGAARLPAAIARERYWLQYLIYTVVLHRLLRVRLPDYDYDRHVGGVLYLFLRGMTAARTAGCGVFHDRPPAALVAALDAWVAGAS